MFSAVSFIEELVWYTKLLLVFHFFPTCMYVYVCLRCFSADSRFAPSQWETVLLCNGVSHWLDANLESTLCSQMGSSYSARKWCEIQLSQCHKNCVFIFLVILFNTSTQGLSVAFCLPKTNKWIVKLINTHRCFSAFAIIEELVWKSNICLRSLSFLCILTLFTDYYQ